MKSTFALLFPALAVFIYSIVYPYQTACAQGRNDPIVGVAAPLSNLNNLGRLGYEISMKQAGNVYEEVSPSLFFKVTSPEMNTSFITKTYKEYNLKADTFKITFPVMTGLMDTLAGQWILKSIQVPYVYEVHTVLLGIKPDSVIVFYIDYNSNHDFSDDGSPYEFSMLVSRKSFTVYDQENREFVFSVVNPSEERRMRKYNRSVVKRSWEESRNKLYFNVSLRLATSGGDMALNYLSETPFNPTSIEYSAAYQSSAEAELAATLSYFGFQAGVLVMFEETEVGELHQIKRFVDASGSSHVLSEPVGRWPHSAFMSGITVSYDLDLPFLKGFYISPVANGGFLSYLNSTTYFLKSNKEPVSETFKDGKWFDWGVDLKLQFTRQSLIYFSYRHRKLTYDASSTFDNLIPGSFSQKHTVNSFGVGFQYRF